MKRNSTIPFRELAMAWVWALVLVLLSSLVALAFNALRTGGLPLIRRAPFDLYTDCPEIMGDLPQVAVTDLPENHKKVVYIDARLAPAYAKEHIPGALFMPMYPVDLPSFAPLNHYPKGTWFVVYGASDLATDKRLVSALMNEKVRGVKLLKGGLKAWRTAKRKTAGFHPRYLPVEQLPKGAQLVDAREEEQFEAGAVKGALNLPFDLDLPPDAALLKRLRDLPRGTPLVVYAAPTQEGDTAALGVFADLRARGFPTVLIAKGGFKAFQEAGFSTQKGGH